MGSAIHRIAKSQIQLKRLSVCVNEYTHTHTHTHSLNKMKSISESESSPEI